MKARWMILASLGLIFLTGQARAQDAYPSLKMGMTWATLNGAVYSHTETGLTTANNAEAMVGTEFMFEYLMLEHIGIEIDYTLSPYQRNYSLVSGGTTIADNIKESARGWSYGMNMYFDKAYRKGVNFLVGVATGTLTVGHEFQGGLHPGVSTSTTMNVQLFRLGMDWTTNMAGLRLRYQGQVGEATNTTAISGVTQNMDYRGSTYSISVYAFF